MARALLEGVQRYLQADQPRLGLPVTPGATLPPSPRGALHPAAAFLYCPSPKGRGPRPDVGRFWDDAANRRLFQRYLPEYLDLYDLIKTPVAKSDLSRCRAPTPRARRRGRRHAC